MAAPPLEVGGKRDKKKTPRREASDGNELRLLCAFSSILLPVPLASLHSLWCLLSRCSCWPSPRLLHFTYTPTTNHQSRRIRSTQCTHAEAPAHSSHPVNTLVRGRALRRFASASAPAVETYKDYSHPHINCFPGAILEDTASRRAQILPDTASPAPTIHLPH